MANSASSLQISTGLSAFAAGYTNGEFIADQVSPIILHDGINGTYHYGTRANAATVYEDVSGDDSEASEIEVSDATTTFTAIARSLGGYVANSVIANADDPLRPKEQRVRMIQLSLAIAEEVRVATALQTTANYASANTAAAAATWEDEASGNPVKDIQTMIRTIAPGMDGNSKLILVLGLKAAQALSRHPSMLSLRAGGGSKSGVLKMEEVATMFDKLDSIFVSDAEYNTAKRNQTASFSKIWDPTKATMVRVPKVEPKNVEGQAIFSARFRWNAPSHPPLAVMEWDEPKRGALGSVGLKVAHWTSVPKIVQNDQGYCLTSVVA